MIKKIISPYVLHHYANLLSLLHTYINDISLAFNIMCIYVYAPIYSLCKNYLLRLLENEFAQGFLHKILKTSEFLCYNFVMMS